MNAIEGESRQREGSSAMIHIMNFRLQFAVGLVWALPAIGVELPPCAGFKAGDRAACGTITVLEDRANPTGRKIDLNVLVLRAEKSDGRAPLFLLAGGPGQAATELVELALGPFAAVREFRDVVLVDQRGTGKSNRIDCPNHSDTDPREAFGALFDPREVDECRKEALQHSDPRFYGTLQVVSDLDEVRSRLGYERVVLWGGSGGTRTALVWLREHPDRVQAVAIDGVAPTYFRAPSGYARGSQDALNRVFADCEAQAPCKSAYPDLRGDFQRLLHGFDGGPIRTFVTKENGEKVDVDMHRGDFGYAVRGMLYNARFIAQLPKMIHAAAATHDLSAFAQLFWMRDVGIRSAVSMGVHFSVFGTEDLPFIDRTMIPKLTEGTFLGTYLIDQYAAACEVWGSRGDLPSNYFEPVRSNVPVLLVSGYYDPTTPPQQAAEVATHLSNSRHIVVRNEAHGAGFGCAQQLVVDFLNSASLAGLGPACEDAAPIEFTLPERAPE